jgi:hypothetical protein
MVMVVMVVVVVVVVVLMVVVVDELNDDTIPSTYLLLAWETSS